MSGAMPYLAMLGDPQAIASGTLPTPVAPVSPTQSGIQDMLSGIHDKLNSIHQTMQGLGQNVDNTLGLSPGTTGDIVGDITGSSGGKKSQQGKQSKQSEPDVSGTISKDLNQGQQSANQAVGGSQISDTDAMAALNLMHSMNVLGLMNGGNK